MTVVDIAIAASIALLSISLSAFIGGFILFYCPYHDKTGL